MAETVLKNCRIYVKGYDLSGKTNQLTMNHTIDMKDRTCFGTNSRQRKSGLHDLDVSVSGFWSSTNSSGGPVDKTVFDHVGATGPITIVPSGTDIKNVAYFSDNVVASYSPSGSIGDLFGFTFAANGNGALARGKVLRSGLLTTDPAASTSMALGTNSTQKRAMVSVHVLGYTGSAGGDVTLEVYCSSAANLASPTTLFSINITTALVGKGAIYTTAMPSTIDAYYASKVIQNDSSDRKFTVMACVGVGL